MILFYAILIHFIGWEWWKRLILFTQLHFPTTADDSLLIAYRPWECKTNLTVKHKIVWKGTFKFKFFNSLKMLLMKITKVLEIKYVLF